MFNRKEIRELKDENAELRKRIGRLEEAMADWRKPSYAYCQPIPLHNISEERGRLERLMQHLGLTEQTIHEHTIITKEKK